jgi:hypothetical protein
VERCENGESETTPISVKPAEEEKEGFHNACNWTVTTLQLGLWRSSPSRQNSLEDGRVTHRHEDSDSMIEPGD